MSDNGGQATQPKASVGGWAFMIALVGIVPISLLGAFIFRDLFKTAGDTLALFSYIAAIAGAAVGVPIAVRGATATAENQMKKQMAQEAIRDTQQLWLDLPQLIETFRKIAQSPSGSENYIIEPGQTLGLTKEIEIPPSMLDNMQVKLATIQQALTQIAR